MCWKGAWSQPILDFPGGLDGKESACGVGDQGSIPGREDPLEKEMATHPGVLAWDVPWLEEPSRPQSMESQRVGFMFQKTSHFLAVHSEEFKYGAACFTVTQLGIRVEGADETNLASCWELSEPGDGG